MVVTCNRYEEKTGQKPVRTNGAFLITMGLHDHEASRLRDKARLSKSHWPVWTLRF